MDIEQRKKIITEKLKGYSSWLIYIILGGIIWLGAWIRTRNIPLLTDLTTGKYIPADPDAIGFLRYVEYLLANGKLMTIDLMRYYPTGYTNIGEFKFLTYFIVYLYKIMHWFVETLTIQYVDIIYPVICFSIGIVFFFLLVKKIFDYRVALVASAFLAIIPSFLFRTISGVSDKEALAIMMMFIVLYLYISSLKTKILSKGIILSILAGISAGLMGLTWGGVNFIFLTIGIFALIEILCDRFNNKDIISYILFVLFTFTTMIWGYPERYAYIGFVYSTTTFPMILALIMGLIKLTLGKQIEKLKINLPIGILSIGISAIAFIILISILKNPAYLIERAGLIYEQLTAPFASTRWALTVAESHQPYLANLVAEMGWTYIISFLAGLTLLFYELIKVLNPNKKINLLRATSIFSIFLFGFTMSRYAENSILNGISNLSIVIYILSIIGFFGGIFVFYFFTYYKKRHIFENLNRLNKLWIFMIIWYIIMFIGARSAIRLIFVFAPVTAILVGFLIINLWDTIIRLKEKEWKIVFLIILIIFSITMFYSLEQTTLTNARAIGPSSYNQQWQIGMNWVRENTPPDAVFAHWWDYGYAVQYGGQRATLSDGGNAIGTVNHFIGRHVLLGHSETEALELLKAKEATNLLIVSEEIGKYPAYSSIGSDRNYDRYSYITAFNLNPQQTQETRDQIISLYQGSFILDEDFIYNNKLYPSGSAGIGGVFMPINHNQTISQPSIALIYNNQQNIIPLECLFINGQMVIYEQKGYPGCFMVIPSNNGQTTNPLGAGLFISNRVRQTLFTHLYLFGIESNYFKLVYDDSSIWAPIMLYQGRVIGPMKIWEISYPNNLNIPKHFYNNSYIDPEVIKV